MNKERIEELKRLDEKLGILHREKKQIITGIIAHSSLICLSIAILILAIVFDIKSMIVVSPVLILFTSIELIFNIMNLKEKEKEIKAICKAVADLVEKDVKEALNKVLESVYKAMMVEESKKQEPNKKTTPVKTIVLDEIKKEPKKTTTKKTTKKATTKKTSTKKANKGE